MIAGRKSKGIPIPSQVGRRFPFGTIPELRAKAGGWFEPPMIDFLVVAFSWLIDIMFVRWIPGPATFIRIEFADEQVPCPARAILSQYMKDPAPGFRWCGLAQPASRDLDPNGQVSIVVDQVGAAATPRQR